MHKRSLIISSVIVAALLVGGGILLLITHNSSNASDPNVVDQKKNAPVQTPEQAANNNKTTQDVPVSSTLKVSNLSASEKNGSVTASADISGSKDDSGTCVFTFANDLARPVVRQVTPTGTAPNLSCNSGSINDVEFSVIGTWKLTMNYYNGGEQATATTNVSIN